MLQHRMVDVLVTTAGGIEEDYIKVGAALFPPLLLSFICVACCGVL